GAGVGRWWCRPRGAAVLGPPYGVSRAGAALRGQPVLVPPAAVRPSESSAATCWSTGTIRSVADSVTRPAGPEIEIAAAVGESGTGTDRQSTRLNPSPVNNSDAVLG